MEEINFNRPYMTGREFEYIEQAHANRSLAGDGPFTERCHKWLEENTGAAKALLTHSCTAALEMAALLLDVQEGDEFIMPSYTFVSTANAFVLRGGIPVFVDVREDTLNLDENLIEPALTEKTKGIVPVHYAGVACEMDTIIRVAQENGLYVIEDAAQGVMSSYKGRPLGSLGHLGAFSFHETKNVISGEGGALLVNDVQFASRAEIIREKGTNRSQFFRGEVDKYSWQDVGSSFLPGELISAFLWAQLEQAHSITQTRMQIWNSYHHYLQPLADEGHLRRPVTPNECIHNAHMYYVILRADLDRDAIIRFLRARSIYTVFHYVPLHLSEAGRRLAKVSGNLEITEGYSERLLRLPLWVGMTDRQVTRVVSELAEAIAAQS